MAGTDDSGPSTAAKTGSTAGAGAADLPATEWLPWRTAVHFTAQRLRVPANEAGNFLIQAIRLGGIKESKEHGEAVRTPNVPITMAFGVEAAKIPAVHRADLLRWLDEVAPPPPEPAAIVSSPVRDDSERAAGSSTKRDRKGMGGPSPTYDWEAIAVPFGIWLHEDPRRALLRFPKQLEAVTDFAHALKNGTPDQETARPHVKKWIAAYLAISGKFKR